MSIESVMPSNHLILCHPLLLLPSVFASIRVFSTESVFHIRWPKYWSFSPSSEYLGLISFRIDWFNLLAVQGTLKSLSQHHSSKASILHRWRIAILRFISWSKSQSYIIGTLSVLVWTNKCLLYSSKTRSGPLSYMLQRATCSSMCNVYFSWCP